MKICIATTDNKLEALVDQVFGRASYFLIIDLETEEIEVITNEARKSERGAGVAAAQTVVSLGAKVVICGNIGPNALMALEKSEVKVISGIFGPAKEVLEKFKKGEI